MKRLILSFIFISLLICISGFVLAENCNPDKGLSLLNKQNVVQFNGNTYQIYANEILGGGNTFNITVNGRNYQSSQYGTLTLDTGEIMRFGAMVGSSTVVTGIYYCMDSDSSNNSTQQNTCVGAGYQCYDMSCSAGFQLMPDLKCPSLIGNRPEVCCKEVVDLSRESKIILNKDNYQEGDFFQATFQLPYNADCNYYFISPSGVEMQEGGGGCGINPSFSDGDITARLAQLFGSAQPGTYQVKFTANKSGYDPITVTKSFQIITSPKTAKSNCMVQNGAGTCSFLGKDYQVTQKGCGKAGSSLDLTFTHDGNTETFNNADENGVISLNDGTQVKINGVPCSVYQIDLSFKKEVSTSITNDGTYWVMKDAVINLNNVDATIREISWALSGDTEPKVEINGNNAQVCSLHTGEECKLFYGPVMSPISKNLIIKVNSIYKNDAQPDESVASIIVTKINEPLQRIEPTNQTCPVEIPPENNPKEQTYSCNGCTLDSKCYPFGYRKSNQYCTEDYKFVNQLNAGNSCENSFQCSSNICVDNKCISAGLWEKFLSWFRRLFGGK